MRQSLSDLPGRLCHKKKQQKFSFLARGEVGKLLIACWCLITNSAETEGKSLELVGLNPVCIIIYSL